MFEPPKRYFFCGIGGSGMMPLALLLSQRGHHVIGSDRSYDHGKSPDKFKTLKAHGITLCPQDGRGVTEDIDKFVVSSAVEDSIPDVKAALDLRIPIIKRGKLLADCFNASETRIAVAGTSGKSTVTGMIATMFTGAGFDPTFVNGGQIRIQNEQLLSVRCGKNNYFIAEMDESDGSIAHYNPSIAILNNIALDHKSMEELEALFGNFVSKAENYVVVNRDDPKAYALAVKEAKAPVLSFGIENTTDADLTLRNSHMRPDGSNFDLVCQDKEYHVRLNVPGQHNIYNALASLSVAKALDFNMLDCIAALEKFQGIHRRMEYIGTKSGITVIDDFAHNPDKIAASLQTLKAFEGRIIVMFQPHGFGPLKLMGQEMMTVFEKYLDKKDYLLMPEAYYVGGTVDRAVTAQDLIEGTKTKNAYWFEKRDEIPAFVEKIASSGDRIIIMGARDDTLHDFAQNILANV